jgi:hypothetical protein
MSTGFVFAVVPVIRYVCAVEASSGIVLGEREESCRIGNRLIHHAHPYAKDAGNDGAFPNHQHSEFDLFFHEMMTNLLFHCLMVGGFVLWLSVLSRTVPLIRF